MGNASSSTTTTAGLPSPIQIVIPRRPVEAEEETTRQGYCRNHPGKRLRERRGPVAALFLGTWKNVEQPHGDCPLCAREMERDQNAMDQLEEQDPQAYLQEKRRRRREQQEMQNQQQQHNRPRMPVSAASKEYTYLIETLQAGPWDSWKFLWQSKYAFAQRVKIQELKKLYLDTTPRWNNNKNKKKRSRGAGHPQSTTTTTAVSVSVTGSADENDDEEAAMSAATTGGGGASRTTAAAAGSSFSPINHDYVVKRTDLGNVEDGIPTLLDVMGEYPLSADIQFYACRVLRNLAEESKHYRFTLWDAGALSTLQGTLRNHAHIPEIIVPTCEILYYLTLVPRQRQQQQHHLYSWQQQQQQQQEATYNQKDMSEEEQAGIQMAFQSINKYMEGAQKMHSNNDLVRVHAQVVKDAIHQAGLL